MTDIKKFQRIWEVFWGKSASKYFIQQKIRVPDSRTLQVPNDLTTFTYLTLPKGGKFPCDYPQIFIPKAYPAFYDYLCKEDLKWVEANNGPIPLLSPSHSTILTGQPGIGVSPVPFLVVPH
jgi:hypothetical protein